MKLRLLLALASVALAQTKLDLRSQGRNIDFSGATSAKPVPVGATLPATCSSGEMFFLTTSSPGGNLYGCVGPNTWAGLGATDVAGADFTDFQSSVSDGVFSIQSGLVNFSVNGLPAVMSLGAGAITPIGGGDSGTFWIYADYNSGAPVLRCSAGPGITLGNYSVSGAFAGGSCVSGTSFPALSIPFARVDVYLGTLQTPVDARALLWREPLLAGAGLTLNGNTLSATTTAATSGGVSRTSYELLPACNSNAADRDFVFTNGVGLRAHCNGISFAWFYGNQRVQLPGSAATFVRVNESGGQNVSDDAGALYVQSSTASAGPVTGLKNLAGATTITAAVMFGLGGGDGNLCGLALADGTTLSSKLTLFGRRASGGVVRSAITNYSDYSSSAGVTERGWGVDGAPTWLRIQISGGTHSFLMSPDGGRNWELISSQASYETATHFGFGCEAGATTDAGMLVVSLQAE